MEIHFTDSSLEKEGLLKALGTIQPLPNAYDPLLALCLVLPLAPLPDHPFIIL